MGWVGGDNDGVVFQVDVDSIGCDIDPKEGGGGIRVADEDE